MDEENWHRMVGVGAAKLGHIVTLTQFHITESFSHSTSLSLFKVFEAASAEKASSSLKKDSELPRSATVLLRIGLAACDWARSQKREVRANCVPLSLSLVGLKVVFC